ncbi:hypothetical protein M3O96_00015 [Aquiflexum sp. TKW24L]|uniref:hypothetical protein n=1 Tax=Aquiflexum sp. TKW24L TaxID=2942212 RepID=UPI0020BDCB1E|nr:hypothetical protein [Aquiflexum sp. TKW24L]MCL6257453.1 hypothetical protein [Aquiflexum sp. TKW24L]
MRVFFSYNSKVQALVDSARVIILGRGHDVFMDRYDIRISGSLAPELKKDVDRVLYGNRRDFILGRLD